MTLVYTETIHEVVLPPAHQPITNGRMKQQRLIDNKDNKGSGMYICVSGSRPGCMNFEVLLTGRIVFQMLVRVGELESWGSMETGDWRLETGEVGVW